MARESSSAGLHDADVKLATVYQQSQENNAQIGKLWESIERLQNSVTVGFQGVFERIQNATAPNFGNFWLAAGVVCTILITIGSIVDAQIHREILRQDSLAEKIDLRHIDAEKALDDKLQGETRLALIAADQKTEALRETYEKGHGELERQVHVLDDWIRDRIKSDLEELRQRRMDK